MGRLAIQLMDRRRTCMSGDGVGRSNAVPFVHPNSCTASARSESTGGGQDEKTSDSGDMLDRRRRSCSSSHHNNDWCREGGWTGLHWTGHHRLANSFESTQHCGHHLLSKLSTSFVVVVVVATWAGQNNERIVSSKKNQNQNQLGKYAVCQITALEVYSRRTKVI